MSRQNADLHGNAPDKSKLAVLLIDVINDLEFDGGEELAKHAVPMAENILALKYRARAAQVPVIYVNDNFGKWQSNFTAQVAHCLEDGVRGEKVARLLRPNEDDYFVLKAKNSGFYSTSLDLLLEYLGTETVILTGIAGNNCVLFTANDAYMRDLKIIVPEDCVASIKTDENRQALELMKKMLKAETNPSAEIKFPPTGGNGPVG